MASIEWVYNPEGLQDSEPQILEAEATTSAAVTRLLESTAVENGVAEEQQFYGDSDLEDEHSPVDPSHAFQMFANNIASAASIFVPCTEQSFRRTLRQKINSTLVPTTQPNLPASDEVAFPPPVESRHDRLHRIAREVDEMAVELTNGPQSDAADTGEDDAVASQLGVIESLRENISRLSTIINIDRKSMQNKIVHLTSRLEQDPTNTTNIPLPPPPNSLENRSVAILEVYPQDATSIAMLDQRIRSLEQILESCATHVGPAGIRGMLLEVRTLLKASDKQVISNIQSNIEQTRALLASSPNMQKLADQAVALQKLKQVDDLRSVVPALATRLKSLKVLHDDMADITHTIAQLGARFDAALAARRENKELLEEVRKTFTTNMSIVQANLDALEGRLQSIEESKVPPKQSPATSAANPTVEAACSQPSASSHQ